MKSIKSFDTFDCYFGFTPKADVNDFSIRTKKRAKSHHCDGLDKQEKYPRLLNNHSTLARPARKTRGWFIEYFIFRYEDNI